MSEIKIQTENDGLEGDLLMQCSNNNDEYIGAQAMWKVNSQSYKLFFDAVMCFEHI